MPLNKTETIKQRSVYAYLPSEQMVAEWTKLATQQKMSLSRFIVYHVEDSLSKQKLGYIPSSKSKLMHEIEQLRAETIRLQEENRIAKLAFKRLDEELQHKRAAPFLDEQFTGERRYWRDLVDALRNSKYITNDSLLRLLAVDPRDTQVVTAIRRQLENLAAYGIVEVTARGWRWKG